MTDDRKPSKAQHLVEGLAERRARHRERSRVSRAAVVAAGVIVLLGGLAMTVLPGPAVVVIPIGLSLLALEFVWAETVLQPRHPLPPRPLPRPDRAVHVAGPLGRGAVAGEVEQAGRAGGVRAERGQ